MSVSRDELSPPNIAVEQDEEMQTKPSAHTPWPVTAFNRHRSLTVNSAPAVLLALALVASACGSDSGSATAADSEEGSSSAELQSADAETSEESTETVSSEPEEWSFTDDSGQTVVLEEQPERIVMFGDVAASLMDFGIDPVGIHFYTDGEVSNELFGDIDLDGIESVGAACDLVNIEAVAALQPDVLLYIQWDPYDEAPAFCLTEEQQDLLGEVAPIITIQAVAQGDVVLKRYEDLAVALGADLESADNVAKRERYEAAVERLEAAVAARPEISVIPVSIGETWTGIAEPGGFADLLSYQKRFGVNFSGPFGEEFTGAWWEEFSAETTDLYRGDVILLDSRSGMSMDKRLEAQPVWAALPEVQAGQIVEWFVPGSFSYTRDAVALELLAEAIENAEDLVTE